MFAKILIANRGEIACRVIRTAQRMGIRCVAVYSDADANAMHVAMADEAYRLGPAPARDSYLKADLILEVAQKADCHAIHPGYGFLSENADFARACEAANIAFIGPPASAIDAMGSKSAAKEIMTDAGVPLVQGYHGDNQDPEFLAEQAEQIGFPCLIKAVAGGGGKGMRIVWKAEEFAADLKACKREALNSFGNDDVLVEKYLTKPRHVEIQVFCDSHDNAVFLFERDCSVQRRHQKVIEEAPAPGLSDAIRNDMGEVAIRAAQAIGYVGAGTVEFLFDEDGSFYFMEMNTRLQVEHPVTELITGQDLVEWQLKVAYGKTLPVNQQQLSINGHAFEARIYAEDPNQDFLPATGTLVHLSTPEESRHVRIDTGIREGDEVSVHYDPMIAKLIVWDENREAALDRLKGALSKYQVVGLTTNTQFLMDLASNPDFAAANLDTNFIEQHKDELFAENEQADAEILVCAAMHQILARKQAVAQQAQNSKDPYSPWSQINGWRSNEDNHHELKFVDVVDGIRHDVSLICHFRGDKFLIELPDKEVLVDAKLKNNQVLRIDMEGKRFDATVVAHQQQLHIFTHGVYHRLEIVEQGLGEVEAAAGGSLAAPMPGTILEVLVAAGDLVEAGQPLVIMEAMKMEHTINAPGAGTVDDVFYATGDLVEEGAELLSLSVDD